MSRQIHPTAIVDPKAELEENVTVGAYSVIGPGVSIGGDCELFNHVTVAGPTAIGPGNRIFPNACIGLDPQDKK